MWLIGMLAEPIVYLVVWTTISEQQGGEVQDHDRPVRRVLHRLDARPEHEHRLHALRLGVADPRGRARPRLRPLHPIHEDIAGFAGVEGGHIILWLPIAAVLWLAFDPEFDVRVAEIAAFCVAIWGAYLIRTMFLTSLGMVTLDDPRQRALRADGRARAAPLRPARRCR